MCIQKYIDGSKSSDYMGVDLNFCTTVMEVYHYIVMRFVSFSIISSTILRKSHAAVFNLNFRRPFFVCIRVHHHWKGNISKFKKKMGIRLFSLLLWNSYFQAVESVLLCLVFFFRIVLHFAIIAILAVTINMRQIDRILQSDLPSYNRFLCVCMWMGQLKTCYGPNTRKTHQRIEEKPKKRKKGTRVRTNTRR